MKKKKRKMTSLIIACAVLIVALCALVLVKKKANDYNDAQSAASTKETLFGELTVDQIESISYTASGAEELTFTRSEGTSSTVEAASDSNASDAADTTAWTCDQHPETTLDSTKVGALASSLTGVSITQEMDGVTDLSQYGLDAPAVTGSFTTTDGKTTSFTIGSTNSAASVVYVCLNDDDSTVYAVSTSLITNLTKGLADYEPDSSTTAS